MNQNEIKKIATLSNYPEWKVENDKLNDLKANRQDLTDEINQLLSTAIMDANKRHDIYSEQAEAMINGTKSDMSTVTVEADLKKAHHNLRVVEKAIDMQRQIVDQARGNASAKACNKLKPEYKQRIGETAKALLVLEQAVCAEHKLRTDVIAGGITFLMRAMPFRHVGFINAEYGDSNILRWLNEADEYGLIDKKKVMKLTDSKEWVAKKETFIKPKESVLSVPMEFVKALTGRTNKTQEAAKRVVERVLRP